MTGAAISDDENREDLGRFGADPAGAGRLFLNRAVFRASVLGGGALASALHFANPEFGWETAKAVARNIGTTTGVKIDLRGAENLPAEASVLTPNHASHFDIVALLGHLPGHIRFAAKMELFREPILGAVMKTLGMVPIDRKDPAKSIERLNRIAAKGKGAFSLIMFPEGTRSPAGGGLQEFKKGAFTLAIQMERPIVPIAIHGSDEVMPRGKYLSIHPGRVVMEVLEPIETKGLSYEDREDLRDRVQDRIRQRLQALRG
jgi:1-acyl-sn-glycerol-3-phosphate acyltransferase